MRLTESKEKRNTAICHLLHNSKKTIEKKYKKIRIPFNIRLSVWSKITLILKSKSTLITEAHPEVAAASFQSLIALPVPMIKCQMKRHAQLCSTLIPKCHLKSHRSNFRRQLKEQQ